MHHNEKIGVIATPSISLSGGEVWSRGHQLHRDFVHTVRRVRGEVQSYTIRYNQGDRDGIARLLATGVNRVALMGGDSSIGYMAGFLANMEAAQSVHFLPVPVGTENLLVNHMGLLESHTFWRSFCTSRSKTRPVHVRRCVITKVGRDLSESIVATRSWLSFCGTGIVGQVLRDYDPRDRRAGLVFNAGAAVLNTAQEVGQLGDFQMSEQAAMGHSYLGSMLRFSDQDCLSDRQFATVSLAAEGRVEAIGRGALLAVLSRCSGTTKAHLGKIPALATVVRMATPVKVDTVRWEVPMPRSGVVHTHCDGHPLPVSGMQGEIVRLDLSTFDMPLQMVTG